jgi:hypothetical protein
MKRKHREAMRAARQLRERPDDDEEEALEARDWHDDWVAKAAPEQQESNNHHWSQE